MFKVAQQTKRGMKDITGSKFVRDDNGNIRVDQDEVLGRWKYYFTTLLIEENPYIFEDVPVILGPVEDISIGEVIRAL